MITRRGFVASLFAGIPLIGALVATRDKSSAQERGEKRDTVLRPEPHRATDSAYKARPVFYIAYEYRATRAVTLKFSTWMNDSVARKLGLVPVSDRDRMPEGVGVPITETVHLIATDKITFHYPRVAK